MKDLLLPIHLKNSKERHVLNIIRLYGEVSGAQIARISNILPSTIVYILRSLKKKELIEISRIGNSTVVGGKPPTLWKLRSDRGVMIGLEVIPKEIRASIVDFSNAIIFQEKKQSRELLNGQRLVEAVRAYVLELMDKQSLTPEKVIGVGVALPGLVDSKNGVVHYSKSLEINEMKLGVLLQESLNMPVRIANDANAGALGISWYPGSMDELPENIVYLTINEDFFSIGAGLIMGHKLYEGHSGTAGEIFPILPPISKLVKKAAEKFGSEAPAIQALNRQKDVLFSDLLKCSLENPRVANFVFRNIGSIVSKKIIDIVAFMNPELIVIGGDISQVSFFINEYLMPYVKRKSVELFPTGISLPPIEFSRFGIYSVSVGATALILSEIFKEEDQKPLGNRKAVKAS